MNLKKIVSKALKAVGLPGIESVLSDDVLELIGGAVKAVVNRDPDAAAGFARRAALKHTFDVSQKLKRGEKP